MHRRGHRGRRRALGGAPHGGHPHALRRLSAEARADPDSTRAAPPGPHHTPSGRSAPGAGSTGGRRSMRSVKMPSTSSASASPIMAKSEKSRWACSRKRWRSAPSIGGMPRVRTASARSRNRATISCGSNPGMAVSVGVEWVDRRRSPRNHQATGRPRRPSPGWSGSGSAAGAGAGPQISGSAGRSCPTARRPDGPTAPRPHGIGCLGDRPGTSRQLGS